MHRFVLVSLVTLGFSLLPPLGARAEWTVEDIEIPPQFDGAVLAFDSTGMPAVAFGVDNVYYAELNDGDWEVEVVAETGCNPSTPAGGILVNELDEPLVFWSGTGGVFMSRRGPGGWVTELTVSGQDWVVAQDRSGELAIAYWVWTPDGLFPEGWNLELFLARQSGGVWTSETTGLLSHTGPGHSLVAEAWDIAFNAANEPVVVTRIYDLSSGLWFDLRTRESGAWEELDGIPGPTISMNQSVKLAYDATEALTYLHNARDFNRWDGRRWDPESTGPVWADSFGGFEYTDLGEGIGGYAQDGELKLVRRAAADVWSHESIPGLTGSLQSVDMVLDPLDQPGLTCFNETDRKLRFTRVAPAGPEHSTILQSEQPGRWPSLAFDALGRPSMSYYEGVNRHLRFARWDGLSWRIDVVDDAGTVGAHSSLAYDAAGNPTIAYYDATNRDLKYARWSGGDWLVEVVDSLGEVGRDCSQAYDLLGTPHISYFDETNEQLKLARWDGSGWDIEVVDPGPVIGNQTHLRFDPSDRPGIGYAAVSGVDPSRAEIRIARWTGAAWDIDWVVDNLYTDDRLNIQVGFDSATGEPQVSYLRFFATWGGGLWPVEEVADARWNTGSALLNDASGRPIMVLASQDGLELATRLSPDNWVLERMYDHLRVGDISLALDSAGGAAAAFWVSCSFRNASEHFKLALYDWGLGAMHRLPVTSLGPGWKEAALPLNAATDEPGGGFPFNVYDPGSTSDVMDPAIPLALYRVVRKGDLPSEVELLLHKEGGEVVISY